VNLTVSWSDAIGCIWCEQCVWWCCACFQCKRVLFEVEEWKLCTASATLSQRTTSAWWVDIHPSMGCDTVGYANVKDVSPRQLLQASYTTDHKQLPTPFSK